MSYPVQQPGFPMAPQGYEQPPAPQFPQQPGFPTAPPQGYGQPPAPYYPPQQPQAPQGYPMPPQGYGPPQQQPTPQLAAGTLDGYFSQPSVGGGAALKFEVNTTHVGLVARPISNADIQQQTNPQNGQPAFYRDGRPKFVMKVPLQVQPSQTHQDGQAQWYVAGAARDELVRAMKEAGAPEGPPEAGAVIQVTCTGTRPSGVGMSPSKVYAVRYQRPGGAAPVAAPAAPPAPVQQVPAPPQPAQGVDFGALLNQQQQQQQQQAPAPAQEQPQYAQASNSFPGSPGVQHFQPPAPAPVQQAPQPPTGAAALPQPPAAPVGLPAMDPAQQALLAQLTGQVPAAS